MSTLNKKNDVVLDVTSNVISGDVVVGEEILIDSSPYTIATTTPSIYYVDDVFLDSSNNITYLFDNNGNSVEGGSTLTEVGNITYNKELFGYSAVFDGASSYLGSVPSPGTELSISLFVQTDTIHHAQLLHGTNNPGGFEVNMLADGSINVWYYMSDGAYTNTLAGAFTAGINFTHIVCTSDTVNHVINIYSNGVLLGGIATAAGAITPSGGVTTYIGKRSNGTLPFSGKLDQLRFFNKTLTVSDVTAIGNEGAVVLTTTPTLPGTITTATTEFKTKLTVTNNIPDTTKVIPTDVLLIDGSDYVVDTVVQGVNTEKVHDVFGDNSAVYTWPLADLLDLGPAANDMSQSGAVAFPSTGKFDGCASFTIDDTSLSVPITLTPEFSVSFWVRNTGSNWGVNYVNILTYGSAGDGHIPIDTIQCGTRGDTGTISFGVRPSNGVEDQTIFGLPTTGWQHILYTSNATEGKVYVNGTLIYTFGAQVYASYAAKTYTLGDRPGTAGSSFKGDICNFRVFNKVLSASEQATLATESIPADMTSTPTMPITPVDVYKKEMLATSKLQTPSSAVTSIGNVAISSVLPDILTSADGIIITINNIVANGDEVYVTDLTSISTVTVANVIDNLDGTYTFNHGQSFTPTEAYLKDNTSFHIVDDAGNYNNFTKSGVSVITNPSPTHIQESYQDLTFTAPTSTVQHFMKQKYTGTQLIRASADYIVDSVDVLDLFGDGSCIFLMQLNGDVVDESGTYTLTPTDVTFDTGKFGSAGVFNGTTSRIEVSGGVTGGYPITQSFWFYDTVGGSLGNIFSSSTGRAININGGSTLQVSDSAGAAASFSNITYTGGYHHFVLLHDGINVTLYFDNMDYTTNRTDSTNGSSIDIDSFMAWVSGGTPYNLLAGNLDQVRIFNRLLTPTEIATLYNEEVIL